MVKHLLTRNLKVKPIFISLLLLLFNLPVFAQPAKPLSPEAAKGEEVFKANCVSCHAMNAKLVGPALMGVHTRRSDDWLFKWIKNNEKLRASGDKEAIAVYNEYGGAAMNVFEHLPDADIKATISYFKEYTPPVVTVTTTTSEGGGSFYSDSTLYILLFLIVILAIVLVILRRTKNSLKNTAELIDGQKEVVEVDAEPSAFKLKMAYYKKRVNPTVFKLLLGIVILGLLATYGFNYGVTEVAVQQGYAPTQPIKYSHKLHAGELKIECRYCHSTVEKSKQASVPSVNTCMNCHKGVQLRDKYNGEISPEIKKIYAAMDYDPDKPNGQQYGPNPKPIRWVRIHNLPDHAVFNHSQHVKGAGVTCQTCHGPIQEMEVVQQYATLQMGWCINCHRESNIDVENNPYYEELHAKIKKEKDNKSSGYAKYFVNGKINMKAAENGGIECSKCHY